MEHSDLIDEGVGSLQLPCLAGWSLVDSPARFLYVMRGRLMKHKRLNLKSFIEEHSSAMQRILTDAGMPEADDTAKTGTRYLKALHEMTAGYDEHPSRYCTVFPNTHHAPLVILKDIQYQSLCAHHTLVFSGSVSIAYVPYKEIIGLSKLARIADTFSKRFQVQESMTSQIATEVSLQTKSPDVYVVVRGEHSCMKCRGVRKSGAVMVTEFGTGAMATPAGRSSVSSLLENI